MGTAVKISDDLAAAAKEVAAPTHRSLTGQIEHWAELGRAVEHLLPTPEQLTLTRHLDRPSDGVAVAESRAVLAKLTAVLASGKGREPALALIRSTGGPVYEAGPNGDRIVQVWPDGRRLVGRLADGAFVAESTSKKPPTAWRSKKR